MLIDTPWGISAFGKGTVLVEPDHARVGLAVNRLSPSPAKSLSDAKQAVGAVRAALRTNDVPEQDVTSSRTQVHSAWDGYGTNRKFLGHQCRVEFAVRITDLDRVEQAVVDAVAAGADEIISVDYDTSRTAELRRTARAEAIAAARDKAELYAAAAGVQLGPVIHIEDVDPERLRPEDHGGMARGAAGSGGGDFAPGQVTVSAAVAVGFSIAR